LIISDCCHSGTICDFTGPKWAGRHAFSISGCRDSQTSGDTGNGGICTHSLLMAVERMQKKGKQNYTLADVYRELIIVDDSHFNSPQDIQCQSAKGVHAKELVWPLIPKGPYKAPMGGGGAATTAPQPAPQSAPQPTYYTRPPQHIAHSVSHMPGQVMHASPPTVISGSAYPSYPSYPAYPSCPQPAAAPMIMGTSSYVVQPQTRYSTPATAMQSVNTARIVTNMGCVSPGF